MNRTRFVRAVGRVGEAMAYGHRVPTWLIVLAAFVAGFMIGEAHVTSLVQAMRTGTYGD